ncbi:hypothetical protein Trydic_g6448 [Trypoxylus dichotomus]
MSTFPKIFSSELNNLYESMYPFHKFGLIVGLLNYYFDDRKSKFTLDKIYIIKNIIQSLIVYTLAVKFFILTGHVMFELDDFQFTLAVVAILVSHALGIINICTGLIFSRKIVTIMNEINVIDVELKAMGATINYRKTWYWSWLSVIFPLISIGISIVPSIYQRVSEVEFDPWETFNGIASILTNILNYITTFQYGIYAVTIGTRYKTLNSYIRSVLGGRMLKSCGK